ncbi:LysR substrate-binding domain-containing protein [Caldimonas sp. KR1-144]|uniref:LysR family transcriptional regulator n=1 Tax=Caldimonas sp. KR1-144 TaxID=3400911 RepID=UPI003C0D9FBB
MPKPGSLDPTNLLLFAQVVDGGSFSAAAARAGLPKSTVSRRVAALERELGERLLQRTTRKLSLTDFGHQLLVHARQVAAEVDAAASLALHRQAQPSGRLRVSLPSDPLGMDLARFAAEFLTRYPAIALDLDLSSRRVDLIGENFDLALRMGDLPDDATLVARRLFEHTWGLYAAPIYLALRGTPREPADLLQHDGVTLRKRDGEPVAWSLQRGDARWEGLPALRAWANSPDLVARLALEGAGIGAVPDWTACRHVHAGQLVRVLPEWGMPPTTGWAVMPGRRLVPAKTRVFLEMFEAALARDLLPELERIPRVA